GSAAARGERRERTAVAPSPATLPDPLTQDQEIDMSDTSFDSKRRLCPDGTCVGVIGADGRCGVCGQMAGEARADAATAADLYDNEHSAGDDHDVEPVEASGAAVGGFDPGRRLCDDGACVGVIGPDGR